MLARALGHDRPREHPGDLVDSGLRVEPRDAGLGPSFALYLINSEVGGGEARDLGKVGDTEDLVNPGKLLELLAHRIGDPASDARVHLVEDQGLPALAFRRDRLEPEDEARELASGRRPRERPRVLPRVRGEEELRGIEPALAPERDGSESSAVVSSSRKRAFSRARSLSSLATSFSSRLAACPLLVERPFAIARYRARADSRSFRSSETRSSDPSSSRSSWRARSRRARTSERLPPCLFFSRSRWARRLSSSSIRPGVTSMPRA